MSEEGASALVQRLQREVVDRHVAIVLDTSDVGEFHTIYDLERLVDHLWLSAQRASRQRLLETSTVSNTLRVMNTGVFAATRSWCRRRITLLRRYVDPALRRFLDQAALAPAEERVSLSDDAWEDIVVEMISTQMEMLEEVVGGSELPSPETSPHAELVKLSDLLTTFSFRVLGWTRADLL